MGCPVRFHTPVHSGSVLDQGYSFGSIGGNRRRSGHRVLAKFASESSATTTGTGASADTGSHNSGNPWRDLQIAKAQYTPATTPQDELLYRDDSPQTQRKPGAFTEAMQPYERNDFAEADRRLGQFTEMNPGHAAAHFYRGVSLLLLGKPAEAIAPLETAVAKGEGRVREEAHWYLALTYLKTGDHLKALEQLDSVIQLSGKRRSDAEALRKQVKPIVDTKQ